jgi:hypothetical protein
MTTITSGTRTESSTENLETTLVVEDCMEPCMERFGPCKRCSCKKFTRNPQSEDMCTTCMHARSDHIHKS